MVRFWVVITDLRAPTTTTWPTCLTNKNTRNHTSRDQIHDRVQASYATRLDEAGFSARDIANYLGHSRISMTQDAYMGRGVTDRRVAEALDEGISGD
ncbi:MAG: hypothetical protein ACRDS0_38090 [Pseudonocardiaceae bacterium]